MSTPASDATQPQPTPGSRPGPASGVTTASSAPRQARLRAQRIDPLSVFKLSFLLSVATGIAGVVLMAVLWMILNGMGVFASVNDMILGLLPSGKHFDLMDYVGFSRVISLSIVVGAINIVLMTALATLGAFLYNICAGLVGGFKVTLTDD